MNKPDLGMMAGRLLREGAEDRLARVEAMRASMHKPSRLPDELLATMSEGRAVMRHCELIGRAAPLRTNDQTDQEAAFDGAGRLRVEVLRKIADGDLAAIALVRAALLTIQGHNAVTDEPQGTRALRRFDDDTLLDMYDHAHEHGDATCETVAAELNWRGIVVAPCGHVHAPKP